MDSIITFLQGILTFNGILEEVLPLSVVRPTTEELLSARWKPGTFVMQFSVLQTEPKFTFPSTRMDNTG